MSTTQAVDYLRFTVSQFSTPYEIAALFPCHFDYSERGQSGYKQSLRCGDWIFILFDGTPEMGMHLNITSKGLRLLEEFGLDLRQFVSEWLERGAKFTRLDYALDDLSPNRKSPVEIRELLRAGHATSPTKLLAGAFHESPKDGMYFSTQEVGSRQSERFVRCYMKHPARGDEYEATRFEIEFKSKYAQAAANVFAAQDLHGLKSMLAEFIDFKDPHDHNNKDSRRKTASWWKELLNCNKLKISVRGVVESTMLKTLAHFERQYAPFLHTLLTIAEGDISEIASIIQRGGHRLKAKHLSLINLSRSSAGFDNAFLYSTA